jgi:hypothetical protein
MSGRVLGTVLAVIVFMAALWGVKKAGDALREQLKGPRR